MVYVRMAVMVITFVAAVTPAMAEDKVAARQAYAEGTKYYDLNQFPEALEAFKRAYWNYEEPALLFNIAQCHRALGHKSDALAFYRSYLRKSPNARNRDEVQKRIAELESAMAQDKAASTAPSSPSAKGSSPPDAPSPAAPTTTAAPPPAAHVETTPPAKRHPDIVATPAKQEKQPRKRAWIWGLAAGVVVVGVAVGLGAGLGTQAHPPRAADGAVRF